MKSFDGESFPISKCSLPHSLCMITRWVDEAGEMYVDRHCDSRVYCSHPEECFFCDKSHNNRQPCNTVMLDSKFYNCYYCDAPDGSCSTVNPVAANRTHFCKHSEKKCFTHVNKGGAVVRGCYFQTKAESVQKACDMDPGNCEICQGDRCNGKSTKMYCYICSAQNALCQFDQMHQAFVECPFADSLKDTVGCYTALHSDGRVERGCWRGEFKCPYVDSQCFTCNTTGCNNATYHSGECLECSGSASGDCGSNKDLLAMRDLSKPCPVLIDRPLCYVSYEANDTRVERGCTAKNGFGPWIETVCKLGIVNCAFCNGNNCNYWIMLE